MTTGDDGISEVWSRSTGEQLSKVILTGERAGAASNSPAIASVLCTDGDIVGRVTSDNTVSFWNATSPVEVRRIATEDSVIHNVGFIFGGRLIAAGSSRGLKVWDEATGLPLDLPPTVNSADATAVSNDGKELAVISGDELILLDVATWEVRKKRHVERRVNSAAILAFAPDGSAIITSGPGFALSVRDAGTLREIGQLIGHTAEVTAVAYSNDSKQILSGGRDHVVRLWNAMNMQPMRSMTGHLDTVDAVIFSPSGKVGYSAGGNSDFELGHGDFAVRQWNLESGQCIAQFTGHQAKGARAGDESGWIDFGLGVG